MRQEEATRSTTQTTPTIPSPRLSVVLPFQSSFVWTSLNTQSFLLFFCSFSRCVYPLLFSEPFFCYSLGHLLLLKIAFEFNISVFPPSPPAPDPSLASSWRLLLVLLLINLLSKHDPSRKTARGPSSRF